MMIHFEKVNNTCDTL